MTSPDNAQQMRAASNGERQLPCEEIQALMLDYMHRDLGGGRSDLIREHTRCCPACRERMAELQNTLGILHDAPFAEGVLPAHLSARHRTRLVRALMHPVLDWIYMHHILVSALVAAIVIATAFFGLRRYRVWRDTIDAGIPVVIGKQPE